jgi:hypothetical protein
MLSSDMCLKALMIKIKGEKLLHFMENSVLKIECTIK